MATALQLADGDPALVAAIQRARRLLNRRALAGAAAGAWCRCPASTGWWMPRCCPG
ncbi:hypothetical protein [Ramlibacter montanisoli]|uniref:hypothetical protein n=1 Tax=Ramlibacter montanisoli TaxID=2732512 RepID=UPI002815D024|nr:hypothetical protein [Ramlibacter montanisoli]